MLMSLNSGRKAYQIAAIERAIEEYGPLTAQQVVELARYKNGRKINISFRSASRLLSMNSRFVVYDRVTHGPHWLFRYKLKSQ